MDETRQGRIATLTGALKQHHTRLAALQQALRAVPASERERLLASMREVEDAVRQLKTELHDLRVQQIRSETG